MPGSLKTSLLQQTDRGSYTVKVAHTETWPWFSRFKLTLPPRPNPVLGFQPCTVNTFEIDSKCFSENHLSSALQAHSWGSLPKKKQTGILSGPDPSQAQPSWECVVSVFDSLMAEAPGSCSSVNTITYLQCWLDTQALIFSSHRAETILFLKRHQGYIKLPFPEFSSWDFHHHHFAAIY